MKNTSLNFFAMLAIFAICSCNKNSTCNTSYTVSGTLLDGKTGLPITDSGIYLELQAAPNYDNNIPGIDVSTNPDKNGKFSMKYISCDDYKQIMYFYLNTPHKNYYIFNPYYSGSSQIPMQQNINRTWTAATNGWLVINLQPLSPLSPGDTLLIQIVFYLSSRPDSTVNYSFFTTQSGVLDSVYLPVCGYGVGWGRGIKNLETNNDFNGFIIGDPYVSRYTIKY